MSDRLAAGLPSSGLMGLGMMVPEHIVTNEELAKRVDTSDEWIRSRTGIGERRVADENTATSDLALGAARAALEDAGLEASELDLIICATTSGDYIWPATACVVQQKLGAHRAAAFDISAACAGFCYALAVADGLIRSGAMRHVLVIGADTLTKQVNWQDRSTCVLFGDGAGAALLGPCGPEEGLLASTLRANGSGIEAVWIPEGGTRTPLSADTLERKGNLLAMKGAEVYRFVAEAVPEIIQDTLRKACLRTDDISLLVLHQANLRIMKATADRLQIPMEKVFVNVDRYGNTSAASVPIALREAADQGRLHRGDVVVTVGYGAGLAWAANVIRWNRER